MQSALRIAIGRTAGIARADWNPAAALAGLGLVLLLALALLPQRAGATTEVQASGLPYEIAIFVSSNPDRCYAAGTNAAIVKLAKRQLTQINSRGGIGGRPLHLRFLDDASNADKTVANAREALATPELLGMIGLTSSDRGEVLFKALSEDIKKSAVPFISDLSVGKLFAGLPNVFSSRPSQDAGTAPVVAAFIKESGFSRVALMIDDDRLALKTLADAIGQQLGADKLAGDYRIREVNNKDLDPEAVRQVLAEIKEKVPDLLVLAVGGDRTPPVLKALKDSGVAPPVMVMSPLSGLPAEIRDTYPAVLYELTQSDLPEVENAALGALVATGEPDEWLFPQVKQDAAPGWKDGSCKPLPENGDPSPLGFDNRRAIERGAQFADMIGLIAAGANAAPYGSDLEARRAAVIDALGKSYASGRGAFRGRFNVWSFDPDTRIAVRPQFVVELPFGMTPRQRQLAPVQFVRHRDGGLRRIDTLYVDVDLIRAHSVDENTKTFLAEFYLAMRASEGADIARLDFTNADVDPRTNGRQLAVEVLNDGGSDPAYPDKMKMYRISGRFLFKPSLGAYPFDHQRFAINIKPKGGSPFIIQPPPAELRDPDVASDNWQPESKYVGINENFVPVVDAFSHQPSVVPFYDSSFAWVMKREAKDYYLRVVVPLAFILLVAYISVFIPAGHFEAIVTIQVTALLSAVALYLSLPQLDSDAATLSDRLFVSYYWMVSAMILLSILRINSWAKERPWLDRLIGLAHVVGVPLIVAAIAWHIYSLSQAT
jgi:ABC-type branched-subunit amino acid transport system substrate-binding protein